MNFKERLKQALKTPNKFGSGGYIEYAGGGDQIVYGARHSQGGVMRDSNTELEGGGFDSQGNPKAGEVITTVYDDGGKPQEFYMSYKNGVAQDYLQAKEMAGGQLNQAQKQEFAKQNESMNPNGSPSDIAANGGYMNYKHGGAHNSDGSKRGFWDNVHAKRNRGESPDKREVSSDTAERFNLANGGMEKYFMGGMQGMIDPRDQALYGQGVDRRSGYSLADGGMNPYDYMMGGVQMEYGDGGLPDWLYKARGEAMQRNMGMGGYHSDEYMYGGKDMEYGSGGLPKWLYKARGRAMGKEMEQGGKKLYPHGGSHVPDLNLNMMPSDNPTPRTNYAEYANIYKGGIPLQKNQNNGEIRQGRDKMGFGEKAWDVITNPLTAFKQYGKYGELQDNFQNMEEDSPLETMTEFINPAAVADMLFEYGKSVKNEGMTTENLAQGAFMLAFRKRMPRLKGADLKAQANKLWNKVKKNEMWANPLGGWNGSKISLKGVKDYTNKAGELVKGNVVKVTGKPGNYTQKSSTPMLTYLPRTGGERVKNVIKKSGKLGAVYGPTAIGYNMSTSETDTSKTMDYRLGDGDFSILTGTQGPTANTLNPDTIPVTPSAELEDLGTTDSIPFTAVGDTLNIEGGNWRRLENSADGNMNWEQID